MLVTHASYILDQVDEVLVMRGGEIVVSGTYDEIKNHPEYKYYSETQKKQEEEKKEKEKSDELLIVSNTSNDDALVRIDEDFDEGVVVMDRKIK